jgi:hypothetical protein
VCKTGDAPLGTRHLSFGGSFYSSALGTSTPLGTLEGAIDLVGGAPDPAGTAALTVIGPVHFTAPILGGTYGRFCVRIDACTGVIDCNGGTALDVETVQDSMGAGRQDAPVVVTTGLGTDAGPGAVELDCQQSYLQLAPGESGDCATVSYPPSTRVVYTTGTATAHFVNGAPKVGSGEISFAGEPFACGQWTAENGPGRLVGTFLTEDDPQAGDIANVIDIDD